MLNRRELLAALLAGTAQVAGPTRHLKAAQNVALHDDQIVLCVLGILQPASAGEIARFLSELFKSLPPDARQQTGEEPPTSLIRTTLERLAASVPPLILEVSPAPDSRYSLTWSGNDRLAPQLRRLRDRTRLFLLKGPRKLMLERSRGKGDNGEGGASPSEKLMSTIERVAHPMTGWAAPSPSWGGVTAVFETGPVPFPRDAPLNLLSFADLTQLSRAGGLLEPLAPKDSGESPVTIEQISRDGLALCIGVSRELLAVMAGANRVARFYTVFELPKRNGGTRTIQSPRTFLKVVQRFILDFLLPCPGPDEHEDVHAAVHSFRLKRSIVTNATPHQRQTYVANLDIKDFFGAIRPQNVRKLLLDKTVIRDKAHEAAQADVARPSSRILQRGGFLHGETASLLARLCTITDETHPLGMLPQGAPTSPMLSNLMLYPIDRRMTEVCDTLGLVYTRYADDITISGADAHSVRLAFLIARKHLFEPPGRMQVNVDKKRVVTKVGQQLVTGVVVNDKVWPSRTYRKNVRAAFDKAAKDEKVLAENAAKLRGHLSYLRSFPDFPRETVAAYEAILAGGTKGEDKN